MGGAFFLSAACTVHPAIGHARGSEGRRQIEQRMTREQIAKAQELSGVAWRQTIRIAVKAWRLPVQCATHRKVI